MGKPFVAAAACRLTQALALLEAEPVVRRLTEGPARREEAHALYRCAAQFGANVVSQIGPLFQARTLLSGTVSAFEAGKDPKNELRINAILRAAAALRDRHVELRWKVGDSIDYPFEHANENVTLGKFVFPSLLPEDAWRRDRVHCSAKTSIAALRPLMAITLPPGCVQAPQRNTPGMGVRGVSRLSHI